MTFDVLTTSQWMTIWLFFSGVFGLIIGSFLNVVIYRVPNNIPLSKPDSHCPYCKKKITPIDNIPLLSYVLLRARCRNCSHHISIRYPLIEFFTSVIFVLTTLFLGLHLSTIGYVLFFAGLIALSAIDIDTKLLPKKIVYSSGAILILFLVLSSVSTGEFNRLRDAAIVGFVYCAFLFIVWYASNGRAMGFGDVRLAIFLGIAMGYHGYIVSYFGMLLSFMLGSVLGIAIAGITHGGRKMKIPFGPFLAAGTVLAIWCAPLVTQFIQENYV